MSDKYARIKLLEEKIDKLLSRTESLTEQVKLLRDKSLRDQTDFLEFQIATEQKLLARVSSVNSPPVQPIPLVIKQPWES